MSKLKKESVTMLIVYMIALSISLIISNFVATNNFTLFGYAIVSSVFCYPIVYFFANLITKKYGYTKTIIAVLVAILVQLVVFFITNNFDKEFLKNAVIVGSLASFLVSQIVNLILYLWALKNKKTNFGYLIAIYLVVLLIDNIIFMSVSGFADLGVTIVISTVLKLIIAAVLVTIDLYLLKKTTK